MSVLVHLDGKSWNLQGSRKPFGFSVKCLPLQDVSVFHPYHSRRASFPGSSEDSLVSANLITKLKMKMILKAKIEIKVNLFWTQETLPKRLKVPPPPTPWSLIKALPYGLWSGTPHSPERLHGKGCSLRLGPGPCLQRWENRCGSGDSWRSAGSSA